MIRETAARLAAHPSGTGRVSLGISRQALAAREARVQENADKLLYLYEMDQIIPVQSIPIERGLI